MATKTATGTLGHGLYQHSLPTFVKKCTCGSLLFYPSKGHGSDRHLASCGVSESGEHKPRKLQNTGFVVGQSL